MPSYNKVILVGHLTRDPEIKQIGAGTTIAEFGIGVNEKYKDSSGQWVDRANFFDCTAFGKTAENITKFFSKGAAILIEGRLRFDQWDDKTTGDKRSKVKVSVETFTFVSSKGDAPGSTKVARAQEDAQAYAYDDEIPF